MSKNVNLKEVQKYAEKFANVEAVKREIKRIQSVKCRLKKQKAREDYEVEMSKVLKEEQLLKEVRDYFEPKKATVTTMTWEQIQELDYDETVKAIKSIQSKKCLSQYATPNINDNVEYQQAVKIEDMLKKHKEQIRPVEETVVRKSKITDLIEHISTLEDKIDKEYILKLLNNLKEQ